MAESGALRPISTGTVGLALGGLTIFGAGRVLVAYREGRPAPAPVQGD